MENAQLSKWGYSNEQLVTPRRPSKSFTYKGPEEHSGGADQSSDFVIELNNSW